MTRLQQWREWLSRRLQPGLSQSLLRDLVKALERNRRHLQGQWEAPCTYTVFLSPLARQRVEAQAEENLCADLARWVRDYAHENGYRLAGRPVVQFATDHRLADRDRRVEVGFSPLVQESPATTVAEAPTCPEAIVYLLEVLHGPAAGKVFTLQARDFPVAVGRIYGLARPRVGLPHHEEYRAVSRHHAHLILEGTQVLVVDMGTNGTWLNGQPLPEHQPHPLSDGDELNLAGTVGLRFRMRTAPAATNSS